MGDKPKPKMIKRFDLDQTASSRSRPGLGNAQKLGRDYGPPPVHRDQGR